MSWKKQISTFKEEVVLQGLQTGEEHDRYACM